ncbi:MAG: FGGY family carbohydrate kinase [Actinobacteria bacterium]|nr:FGGY family carbohydrate kinase [Actinomycetota bacterium]
MSLLGIDVGTTGCKAVAFNLEGRVLGHAYKEYELVSPYSGWVELNPLDVWRVVKLVVAQAVAMVGDDRVEALSLSVLGEAVIPVAKTGEILYNAVTSPDNRSIKQSQTMEKKLGHRKIYSITGQPIHPSHTLNKILWFLEERPDIFAKTWKFLLFEDFLFFKMGLRPTLDYSLASRTLAFDIHKKRWSEQILSYSGISADFLADVLPSGEPIGEIPSQVIDEMGLSGRVIAVTGGHDQLVAALGAGLINEGMAVDSHGTTECVTVGFNHAPNLSSLLKHNYPYYCHVRPDMYVSIAFNYTAGNLLRWYRDNFGFQEIDISKKTGRDVYEIILGEAVDGPTNLFILPYFAASGTPYMDALASGAVIGLTLETKRADLIRAIMESTCYELKLNLELLEESSIGIEELRAVGGAARSHSWLQLKADICDKCFHSLGVEEVGCLGAAILAGYGAGIFDSFEVALDQMLTIRETFEPDQKRNAQYVKRYDLYKELYPRIKPLSHRIATIREPEGINYDAKKR